MGLMERAAAIASTLLASIWLQSVCVASANSVNVELKTWFPSAPYLVELLETAADENSTSYLPLLDRIADGYFATASTEQQLYEQFIAVLKNDGHMNDEALSAYKLSLSLRTTAPRIEAHYQYYETAVKPALTAEQNVCAQWMLVDGNQFCSPSPEKSSIVHAGSQVDELQFDRILGDRAAPAAILYADITSPYFADFHKLLSTNAAGGMISYRLRHKPTSSERKPLVVSGYGVELALKRTDYIVIDDREAEDSKAPVKPVADIKLDDEEIADVQPLTASELANLAYNAASFVLQSDTPFETLLKLTQDFPKFSSSLATHNYSAEMMAEHQYNRNLFLMSGRNVVWMNGIQIMDHLMDPYTLVGLLRTEREFIDGFKKLGLSAAESVQLIGHPDVEAAKADENLPRFDWRDTIENDQCLVWLNNIETDSLYADWPSSLKAIIGRTYPGQLPSVRRDVHNVILTVDLSSTEDIAVVQQLQQFILRGIAVRFGFVPLTKSAAAVDQAKVFYYILDTFGLFSALEYLDKIRELQQFSPVSTAAFDAIATVRPPRDGKTPKTLAEVLESKLYQANVDYSQQWVKRLAADSDIPPVFVNGIAIPRGDGWLPAMSRRISADLQSIQGAVFNNLLEEDFWVPDFFLKDASARRNPLISPDDASTIQVFDMSKLDAETSGVIAKLPTVQADLSTPMEEWAHLMVFADLDTEGGRTLVANALEFKSSVPSAEVVVVPSSKLHSTTRVLARMEKRYFDAFKSGDELAAFLASAREDITSSTDTTEVDGLINHVGLVAGQNGVLMNGRLVGPIPEGATLTKDDLEQLLTFERVERSEFVFAALQSLGYSDKITTALSAAKLVTMVEYSAKKAAPDGIYETTSTMRTSTFEQWNSTHTVITVGSPETATIQLTASIDPASKVAQKWLPILHVLSKLDGVSLKLFVNPRDRLEELPVTRFYRYLFDAEPIFNADGSLANPTAAFSGVPQEALLTMGMDVPPSWLVASNESVYDLDNIKLSTSKGDVTALYQLEHILIEGHSRELPSRAAPRGAQLVLQTASDPHYADTLIMSNVGYFQFKANPGVYNISLDDGRTSDVYAIKTLDENGWRPAGGNDSLQVSLMSFQGITLYPRLVRKPGMEEEDVLETKADSAVNRGFKFAESILGGKSVDSVKHADINIFSVASGHLYERMLNIMMVSVMKHTKHTVKFWFIEQFLSPSFKDFIPHLAAEYGFQYEMVTYKWPHWLRAQTEKQREIWGYKILFLDVLFPLSLDKVIFVDADQIVRTDMIELVNHDLKGAPYGFTPMCDSRTEMEGFRFWKQGYWKNFLNELPYHISALYVVDLKRFRQMAAGDRLRQQYQQLSADPNSLANLDQDLPNHMQAMLPIHSLPQEWLWCETWCSDESLATAKTIDLCNNPLTKEPKLDRARRQVPEWTEYDEEIAALDKRRRGGETTPTESEHVKDEL